MRQVAASPAVFGWRRRSLFFLVYPFQDDVPAFSNSEAFAIIERELGRPLEEVFEYITDSPIAAASLGQASAQLSLAFCAQITAASLHSSLAPHPFQ